MPQGVEVVAAFEHGDGPPGRHQRHRRAVRAAKSPAVRPSSVSGSSRWASKPAEISSHVGANRSTAGAMTSSNAREIHVAGSARRKRDVQSCPAPAPAPVSVRRPVPG